MDEDDVEKLKLNDAIQMHMDTKIAIENYVADIEVDGKQIELALWDTGKILLNKKKEKRFIWK